MANKENQWGAIQLGPDNSAEACALLPELARNEIAAIQIGRFLCEEELDVIKANMEDKTIAWYANKTNQQGRIGINATGFSHEPGGKTKYFDATPAAEKNRDEIFEGTRSPINKILAFFGRGFNTKIATEPELAEARYFAGLIRAMGAKSTLHFDYAPKQLPGWSVANADEQFGLVLYLQMPKSGGALNIYDHPWTPEDERHNNDHVEKGTFGFTEGFLGDTPYASVLPSEGDLVVFKTRNFHQVDEINSDRPRLGLTTFMSQQGDTLSLWS
ncbi:MAG TPA: 2OG-Fe(II) oxygenase [Candidatus Saccharimonadales bacterium]|nr:2OG-Fe(II) oxygenase [Candidatus Saccharimonadales bacterium]